MNDYIDNQHGKRGATERERFNAKARIHFKVVMVIGYSRSGLSFSAFYHFENDKDAICCRP